jgi:esterase/lipase
MNTLPPDLDAWLRESEAAIRGITPGAEKTIVWAGEVGVKTAFSIIYIHGFTATRQEVAPVYDDVARTIGANLFYTRLAGHGLDGEALAAATLDDWVNDTREAYRIGERLGGRVIVAATSSGVPLALWLASQQVIAPSVAALVLASANVKPADPGAELLLWPRPLRNIVLAAFVGAVRTVPTTSERDSRFWTKRYASRALVTMMETVRLGRKVRLDEITVPSLWLYAANDDVVSIPEMKRYYQRIGSTKKSLVELPHAAGHVLAGDIMSPASNDEMEQIVAAFLADAVIQGRT